MSNWRQQVSGETGTAAVTAWLHRFYHVPVILVLLGFALWNRARNWSNFIVGGEVKIAAHDPWYHLWMTEYTVYNFPDTQAYDPWTHFPIGTAPEQFGTLFDQVIALIALIVGLGSPSEHLIRMVFLFSPLIWIPFLFIVAYYIGKRLGGRAGGIIAVSFIALAPDRLLQTSVVGNVQHHPAEALFMGLSVLAMMVALRVAEVEKPVYELLLAREYRALRRPIGWGMLAGVAMALYVWVWPPGMYIFGILAVFFVFHLSWEHVRGRSPDHAAFVGVIALTTAGLLQLSTVRSFEISATSRSLLQPGFALAVVGGILFLAWLSRFVEAQDQPRRVYPAAVGVSILASAGLMWLLLPGMFDFFISQTDRVLGFITAPGDTAGTIGEAQPMPAGRFVEMYKLAIFTAALGGVYLLARQVIDNEPRGEHLLIVVWSVFIVTSTLTQIRFGYYMTIVVGALNAALIGAIIRGVTPSDTEFNLETYQVLTIAAIVLFMFVPLLAVSPTAVEAADGHGAPGDIVGWSDSLDWMEENTPEPGLYANPDGEPMERYVPHVETDNFDYPAGAYGVMSWWDYGHWITTEGERIPNANPFQEGTDEAAAFLLAQDEDEAMEALEVVDDHEDAKTRYVMVDWKMVETETQVGGKYFAPPQFKDDVERSDFYSRFVTTGPQGGMEFRSIAHKQAYYQSTMVRLYHYHGSSQDVEPVVLEWQGQEQEIEQLGGSIRQTPDGQSIVHLFDSIEEAEAYVEETPSSQLGGIGPHPEEPVPALEHFRLVHMDEISAHPQTQEEQQRAFGTLQHGLRYGLMQVFQNDLQATGLEQALAEQMETTDQTEIQAAALDFLYPNTPSWTKTFERVPGATIAGTGPADETLTITVPLDPANGEPFEYTQRVETDADGTFETTVPYATTGYDDWGTEEGYTDHTVEATEGYTISTGLTETDDEEEFVHYVAELDVTEGQVLGEEPDPDPVTLEQETVDIEELFDLPGEDDQDETAGTEDEESDDEEGEVSDDEEGEETEDEEGEVSDDEDGEETEDEEDEEDEDGDETDNGDGDDEDEGDNE